MLFGVAAAFVAGLGFGVAAAVQKREAVQVSAPLRGLLPALARRPIWVAAWVATIVAWVAQVVAFARAPIAVVMPFLALGTALLVVLGVRWLGERFTAGEIAAVVALTAGAALTALASSGQNASTASLGWWPQIGVAAVGMGAGAILATSGCGVSAALAAGSAFAVTSLLSKEIADRFARDGAHALPSLVASPTPWLLAAAAFLGTTYEQRGFQRANAATVSAVASAVDIGGTVAAGTVLYGERLPSGASGVGVVAGIVLTVAGLVQLARSVDRAETGQ